MSNWVQGKVVERIDWNERLFSLKVDAPVDKFVAGQFGKLAREEGGERVQRAYSFVNSPSQSVLEFLAVTVEEGELSPHLQDLTPGDEVMVSTRPNGFLTLDEVPAGRELWMFATGTAVGPFLSILQSQESWERYETFVLVYAVRQSEDLAYLELIESIQAAYPDNFRFVPIVSREDKEGTLRGRIPELLLNGEIQAAADVPIAPARSQTMICGNPDMIRDTVAVLESMGLRKNLRRTPGQITVEKYW
ncbi:ferredoxin--NADP reductase [Ferrimonas lipolytica]|uniref:ferredoxin--NADP(+) reductase n=1 Tax=Ferrimonas lipolytica TaxID=2724191 RepID=A0A6H1UGI5_9GAMM|nr:ferredoxin--NADP reductase [Ferrimonas lipolytica]QIZ77433.1 ferredoxin--NADP reductase [Ferrimonas lipolytica]